MGTHPLNTKFIQTLNQTLEKMKMNFGLLALAALSFATLTFTGCNNGPEPVPVVTIVGDGIGSTVEIKKSEAGDVPIVVEIKSNMGIENFMVSIESSSAAFMGNLTAMGLGGEFDLANPGTELGAKLTAVGLVNGAAVKSKTELKFDITNFIPMIFQVRALAGESGSCTVVFNLAVVDTKGTSKEAVINLNLIDDVAIAGDGFDINGPVEILESESAEAIVKVDVSALNGIDKFMVHIDCTRSAFMALLDSMLGNDFDLANPGDLAPSLTAVGLPNGTDVKTKTELKFDISSFIPMIFLAPGTDDFTASFKITVSDAEGNSAEKTLTLNLIDDVN